MVEIAGRDVSALVCDLDGVVYRGAQLCDGARAGLERARELGLRIVFLTNNAGHTRTQVVDKLTAFGLAASIDEVVTSSWVAAHYLARRRADAHGDPRGESGTVLAVGGPGVLTSLREVSIRAISPAEVRPEDPAPSVVVQGYGPDMSVRDLTEAAYAIRSGALWIATNTDATLPTERGQAPGNGSLIAAVAHATGRSPDLVVGKPHTTTYDLLLDELGLDPLRVLAVGDRLDTDIDGARAAGLATALVLTGVHQREDVERRPPAERPDLVVPTLNDLFGDIPSEA